MIENTTGTRDTVIENDNHYIEAGEFALTDQAKRVVSGILLPFGEVGTNPQGDYRFSAGSVSIPDDTSDIKLTVEHGGPSIGHAVALRETERGIEADFAIDAGLAGDRFLSAYQNGRKHALSGEFSAIVRRGVDVVSSTLRGVAAVVIPGFESAALFSAADMAAGDDTEIARLAAATSAALAAAEERLAEVRAQLAELTETPEETPVSEETETPESTPDEEEKREGDFSMENAQIPAGVGHPAAAKEDKTTASGLFSALAKARQTGDQSGLADFALGSIQNSGPSTVTIGADVSTPAYIGELWTRKAYNRQFIPLFGNAPLTSYKINGWRWADGKRPEVDVYAGNNAEVPSNAVDTEPYSVDPIRIAGAHRIDQKFRDFSDSGFWESYTSAMVESYARRSDRYVLDTVAAAATVVIPGTVPSGIAKALAAIVDGALAVIAQENTPSFAVVNSGLWRDIVLTFGENSVLTYLSASFGLEEGQTAGFRVIPSPLLAANKVLVGAREAATVYEFGGSPIRVEGLVPANGAIEPAVYGYLGVVLHNAKALASVTVTV